MTKLAAIYARVSTSDQADRGESLPSQVESCRAYALRLGFQVAEVFQEDISGGTRFVERPDGARLDALVRSGQVGAVIIFAVDRFSRRTGDAIVTAESWLECGAELHMLDVGRIEDANNIVFVIKGWQGTDEKAKIRERTMRGRRHAIEGGRVVRIGPGPYGYEFIGEKKDTRLVVVEPEAQVVRSIFEWFTVGNGDGMPLGAVAIGVKLARAGVPGRNGGRWTSGAVYPILKRETYAGTWNAYQYLTGIRAGRPWRKRRPRAEWVGVPCPAIVDRATWQAAQAKLNGGRHEGRDTATHDYVLAGHLVCTCGYHVSGHAAHANGREYIYYRCNGTNPERNKRRCDLPGFRGATWEAIVWDFIHDLLMHPEKLAKGLRAEQDARRRNQGQLLARLELEQAAVAKWDGQLDNLARQLYQGRITEDFHDREKPLVTRLRDDAAKERDDTQAQIAASTLSDERIATLFQMSTEVAEVVEGLAGATFDDKRKYLAWLEFSGRLAVENGEQVLYAACKVLGSGEHRLPPDSATPRSSS
jgi:site-specific DNA recombinase